GNHHGGRRAGRAAIAGARARLVRCARRGESGSLRDLTQRRLHPSAGEDQGCAPDLSDRCTWLCRHRRRTDRRHPPNDGPGSVALGGSGVGECRARSGERLGVPADASRRAADRDADDGHSEFRRGEIGAPASSRSIIVAPLPDGRTVVGFMISNFTIAAMFFVSGAAGLMFEMARFHRGRLALGSSIWAATITVSSFMGGLALGNALIGRVQIRRPLRVYALAEITLAAAGVMVVYALASSAPMALLTHVPIGTAWAA